MFTVKVREGDPRDLEDEVVLEATQVRKAGRKVILDCEDGTQIEYEQREARAAGDRDCTMYVMNRFGATVSTYHL